MKPQFEVVDVELHNGEIAKGLIESNTDESSPSHSRPNPVIVDFHSSKLKHRIKNGVDGEAVVKAMGLKRSERAGVLIYDFTAGLGTEAFLLAKAGFRVVAFERNPLVFTLLQDGFLRWRNGQSKEADLQLEFRLGDAVAEVQRGRRSGALSPAHAVVLDPMFEDASTDGKSAPKKEMALLRRMLASTTEIELREMFQVALSMATARVVVKRPSGAPDVVSMDTNGRALTPAHRLEGKTARFDIYSCR